jgi:hypothetical protein
VYFGFPYFNQFFILNILTMAEKKVKNLSQGIFYDGINDPISPGKIGILKKTSALANQALKFGGLSLVTEVEAKEEAKETEAKKAAATTKGK